MGALLSIEFVVEEPDTQGRMWVKAQTEGGPPLAIGYAAPRGDGFEARGSGEGWPLIDICADETRALCAMISTWGREMAELPDEE